MSARKGIALRLIATGLFACMALCVKKASAEVPVGQVVFWRSSVALIPIVLYLLWLRAFPGCLRTKHWKGHLTRSLYGGLAMFLSFIALAWLPLSLAAALGFLAPLFAIPVAAFLLGERPPAHLVAMVVVGFLGVVVILYPTLDTPELSRATLLGCLAGLGMALTTAFAKVKIKQLTHTEHAGSIAFYFSLICSLLGLTTFFFGWAPLQLDALFWLTGAGLFGGIAHVVMTESIARASVSTLAVFEYTSIFWALALDYSFFGGLPDPVTLLGIGIIVYAGLSVGRAEVMSAEASHARL